MVQAPNRLRLLSEPAQPIRVVREGSRQDLYSYLAIEPPVERAINLSHPARADRRQDFVWTKLVAHRNRHNP